MSDPNRLDAILSQLWVAENGLDRFTVLQQLISYWDGAPEAGQDKLPDIAMPLV